MKKDVHIGKLIKQKLSESNLSIVDFAEAIHKTRTTVYDIFNRKSIDSELLIAISEVLQFDFISYAYGNSPTSAVSSRVADNYLIIKIVKECELEEEEPILFRYKLKL
ncbi:helix-turn-helix transcriptional regulator [uncultured Bacteroides sp.]|uniref:helix-turn-helix domain-containing protein n=1 Tax=uncultured Bacteroides sp. TaxID=162156 RepID=UPI0025E84E4C|nr:helix-turn-helix transcriptional regulator [uncultured Bacteroides sp.]